MSVPDIDFRIQFFASKEIIMILYIKLIQEAKISSLC